MSITSDSKKCPKCGGPAWAGLFGTIALLIFIPGRALAQTLSAKTMATIPSSTSFENIPEGVYPTGAVLDGWIVATNEVGIVADPKGAHRGSNCLALTSGHIAKTFVTRPGVVYQLQLHGKGPGLTDWWPGDGTANDIIGANNGTPQNMTFNVGKVDQAFSFNGNNSEVDFGADAGNFGTNDFTVDFWIRQSNSVISEQAVMEKRVQCNANVNFWEIQIGGGNIGWTNAPAGHLKSYIPGNNDTFVGELVSSNAVNDGVFHHVALVRQGVTGGAVYSYYIDGLLDSTNLIAGIANLNNPAPFRIGQSVCVSPGINGSDRTQPFSGDLDELDLFNRALCAAEIHAIYLAGSAGKYGDASTFLPNFELIVDGVTTDTIILDDASGPWQFFTNNFTAKKSQSTIQFEGNAIGVLINDIQIIELPP